MMNFANFITEAREEYTIDGQVQSNSFMRYYSKYVGKEYVFVDKQKFTNKYGSMVGYLYINETSAIRNNYLNGKFHSISYWTKYSDRAPERTVVLKRKNIDNKGLIAISPQIGTVLGMKQFAYSTVWGSETMTMPNGEVVDSVEDAICNLYEDEYSLPAICKLMKEYEVRRDDVISVLDNCGYDIDDFGKKKADGSTIGKSKKEEDSAAEKEFKETIKDIEPECALAETVEETKSDKLADDAFVAQLIADPLPVFQQLNSYVLMTARRINNALLITGQGGVGKSYNVNRILSTFGTEGKDYVIMKGNCTPTGMYNFLYEHYNKIVVFDDCDSVLESEVGLNILKGALDSGKTRTISWNSKSSNIVNTFDCKTHEEIEERLAEWSVNNKGKVGMPNTFTFSGGCIFISNLSAEAMAKGKAAALLTRCMKVDINLLAKDVILRMQSCLPSIKVYNMDGKDITDDAMKKEVFEWISSDTFLKDPRVRGKEISFRLFNKAYMFRYACLPQWKELSFCV